MNNWQANITTEAIIITEMLHKHAGPMSASFSQAPRACQQRDASFRRIFQPFDNVTELRQYPQTCKKGTTRLLTTVDEICALVDAELLPMLAVIELIFASEAPDILKLGDIVPLPKDLKRARPITCLDALFKIVDKTVGTRLMQVCQEYGLILANAFGFIPDRSCDLPIECVSSVQHRARNEDITAFMFTRPNDEWRRRCLALVKLPLPRLPLWLCRGRYSHSWRSRTGLRLSIRCPGLGTSSPLPWCHNNSFVARRISGA